MLVLLDDSYLFAGLEFIKSISFFFLSKISSSFYEKFESLGNAEGGLITISYGLSSNEYFLVLLAPFYTYFYFYLTALESSLLYRKLLWTYLFSSFLEGTLFFEGDYIFTFAFFYTSSLSLF